MDRTCRARNACCPPIQWNGNIGDMNSRRRFLDMSFVIDEMQSLDTDGDDLPIWQCQFGLGNSAASTVVSEPTSWLLLLTGMAATVFSRWRRVVRMFRILLVGTCPATVNFLACWTSPVDSSHPVVVCRSTLSQEKTR